MDRQYAEQTLGDVREGRQPQERRDHLDDLREIESRVHRLGEIVYQQCGGGRRVIRKKIGGRD